MGQGSIYEYVCISLSNEISESCEVMDQQGVVFAKNQFLKNIFCFDFH